VASLAGASEQFKNRILMNISSRARQMVTEDLAIASSIDPAFIGKAQAALINVANRLIDTEEIAILDQPVKSEPVATTGQDKQHDAIANPDQELAGPMVSRRNLRELIQFLAAMASKSRREGLLGLEDAIDARIDEEPLRNGMQLIVDGTDASLVRNIMEVQKKSLLAEYERRLDIMIEGALSISAGDNPRITEEKCRSFTQSSYGVR